MGFSRQEYWSGLPFPSPLARIRHLVNICLFEPPDLTLKQIKQNILVKTEYDDKKGVKCQPKLEGHGGNTQHDHDIHDSKSE